MRWSRKGKQLRDFSYIYLSLTQLFIDSVMSYVNNLMSYLRFVLNLLEVPPPFSGV